MSSEKADKLSKSAYAYMAQMINEYRMLAHRTDNTQVENIAIAIAERFNDPEQSMDLRMHDLRAFEAALLYLKPIDQLRREAWNLRSRYSDIVGSQAYSVYERLNPPDPATAPEAELRADMQFVQSETFRYYLFLAAREDLRSELSMKVATLTVIVCMAALGTVMFSILGQGQETLAKRFALIISLVIASGTVGGFLSMQRRLQTSYCEGDPVSNITQLRHGKFSLFLAPLSGAVFALVIYTLLAGQFLEGVLFPRLVVRASGNSFIEVGNAAFTFENYRATVPYSIMDCAKLFIWCFLGGFAERLVPDTLSRIVGEAEKSKITSVPIIPPSTLPTPVVPNNTQVSITGPASVPQGTLVSYQATLAGSQSAIEWSVEPADGGQIVADPNDSNKAVYQAPSAAADVTIIATPTSEPTKAGRLTIQIS